MISFSRNITRIRCFREIKAIKIYSHSFASLPEKSDKELLKEADTIEHFLEVGSGYNISTISKEKENAHSFDDPSYPLHSSWLHLGKSQLEVWIF